MRDVKWVSYDVVRSLDGIGNCIPQFHVISSASEGLHNKMDELEGDMLYNKMDQWE